MRSSVVANSSRRGDHRWMNRFVTSSAVGSRNPSGGADIATKHDLARLERRLERRFDRLDDRFDRLDDRFPRVGRRFAVNEDRTSVGISEFRASLRREFRYHNTVLFFGAYSMILIWFVIMLALST